MRIPHAIARPGLAALLSLTFAAPALAQSDWDPRKLPTPPLGKVQVPKPERWVMPNGIVVYLLEDHDLPVVTGTVNVLSSPTWVADDKAGLAGLTGEVMRSGGSARVTGDFLDDRLASIGASITSSLGADQGSSGFRCLTENTAEVIGHWAEVIRRPAFPEDKIELAKVSLRQSIASRNDEMIPLLVRVANEAVMGKGNPYARKPEYATVEAITRDDVVRLHQRAWVPERMVMAVYGDFQSAAIKKQLLAAFGDMKKSGTPKPPPPPMPTSTAKKVVFAPKDDVTQTGVILATLGHRAIDPDYAAMNVLETALGGGFQSRLFNRIRTERGLAYAAGASGGGDWYKPGVFLSYTLSRNDSAMTAHDLLRLETLRVTGEPLSAKELEVAKQSVQNSFVFNFESPSQVLFRSAFFELIGYPADFLTQYQQKLEAVDAAAVQAAAKQRIRPDQLVTVIVGKESEFDRPLDTLVGEGGALERVDIRIPPPPSKSAVGAATPEALAEGQALLAKAAEQAGGSRAFAAVKAVSQEATGSISMQGQTMNVSSRQVWALPDRLVTTLTLPMGEMKQGTDGRVGWMSMMGQTRENPPVAQSVRERYERSFFRLFGRPAEIQVQALPEPRVIDGVSYRVAAVKSEVVRDLLLFFAPDGQLARIEYGDEGPNGPAVMTEIYADWKPVGAIRLPHAQTTLMDGKPFMTSTVTSAALDPAVDEAAFKMPTQ